MEGRALRHDRHTVSFLTDRTIDMAVNLDHVHFFVKYPPKYSVSYVAKRIEERSSRELRKAFLHLKEWLRVLDSVRHPAYMARFVMEGMLWRDAHLIMRM